MSADLGSFRQDLADISSDRNHRTACLVSEDLALKGHRQCRIYCLIVSLGLEECYVSISSDFGACTTSEVGPQIICLWRLSLSEH